MPDSNMLGTTWRKIIHIGSIWLVETKLERFSKLDTFYVGGAMNPKKTLKSLNPTTGAGNLAKVEGTISNIGNVKYVI